MLTLIGGVLAAAILSVTPRWSLLRRAVGFLTSEHPNGSLLPRRYARVVRQRCGAEVSEARHRNFDARFAEAAGQRKTANARGFIPTAKFVAPTNTLDDRDATRYFLFLRAVPDLRRASRPDPGRWREDRADRRRLLEQLSDRRRAHDAARQVLVVHSVPVVEEVHEHGEDSALSLSHRPIG